MLSCLILVVEKILAKQWQFLHDFENLLHVYVYLYFANIILGNFSNKHVFGITDMFIIFPCLSDVSF